MDYSDKSYVEEGLGRFISQPTISLMLNDIRVMPITSDPTREDSDGDEVLDIYDKNPLIPIDVFSPCLNSDYGCELEGVENHDMVINLPDNCKTYICTNCGYTVTSPEFEDYNNLDKTDFVMVRTLISIYNEFYRQNHIEMADMVYSLIDKIRCNCTLKSKSYSYSDVNGNYVSPCIKLSEAEETEFYVNASICDYTGYAELKGVIEYIDSIYGYVLKDVGDVVFLFCPVPMLSACWATCSEGIICIYENRYNNNWSDVDYASHIKSAVLSSYWTYLDDAVASMPIISTIVTARSVLSHVGIYITNAYEYLNEYLNWDDGYSNDYKILISFNKSGVEDNLIYSYNLSDIIVDSNIEINMSYAGISVGTNSKIIPYKNTFLYNNNICDELMLAIRGRYYYKRDITDDDFSWVKYYEKTTIPVKNE